MGSDALDIDADGMPLFRKDPACAPERLDVATALELEQETLHSLCIINCYLQLVSRQDWTFPLSPTPFLLFAATPATALLWLYAIP